MYKILFFFGFFCAFGQKNERIDGPKNPDWNIAEEGKLISIKFQLTNDSTMTKRPYVIKQGKVLGMEIDSTGNFTWLPSYQMVERNEPPKIFQIIIETLNNEQVPINKNVDLIVKHSNRKVVVSELKTFYVRFNTNNTYLINNQSVYDEDNDQIVFIPNLETTPEGFNISSTGEISWEPSLSQFKKVKEKPIYVEFWVQDQPAKELTVGRIKIEATQQDLSPEIVVVPKKDRFLVKENETLNLRFYLSDPNGEEDIKDFDFLTNLPNFDKKSLVRNALNQYEFIWTPGYDFVQDPADTLGFYADFFVIDKTAKREVKRIFFTVKNTVNEAESDRKSYNLYHGTMHKAWELMEQLKEKEDQLKRTYSKARKGKKQRSVVNASFGATTGLSSIFTKNDAQRRMISSVGGTTVLTIGTLEATEVIGKSMKDIIDRLNYVIEKKNDIQTRGDIYARDFSLKSTRRSPDFIRKTDDFMATLSLKGLVALELSATWEAKQKVSDENIRKTYKDFVAW